MTSSDSSTGDIDFLKGGGEMGELTRNFDWSHTPIGSPGQWPQSLRTTLSIILNSKFPMFLFWGTELICFYNDAYRPSLGNDGKHPGILGMKGEKAWPEIWSFIKPLIDQVLEGNNAVWFEDQFLPIYRNGKMEDVYWTFSYSAVNDESGGTAGVFVTCTETTEKVANTFQIKENEERLRFALNAGNLGSWELNLENMELNASALCKINFGKPVHEPFSYQDLKDSIHIGDIKRMEKAVASVIETGNDYNIEYRTIWPDTTIHWVNVRGRLRYGENGKPASMAGVSIDITERKNSEALLQESEAKFRNIIKQAPVAIAIFEGPEFIIDTYNEKVLEFWGRTAEQVAGKPLFKALPEASGQGFEELLTKVFIAGERFVANELPVTLLRNGILEKACINFIYDPIKSLTGEITGIIVVCHEVTDQVNTRIELERVFEQARLSKESAQLGTFDMDLEKGIMEWDERCRILFGISHKNAVTYQNDFVPGMHPDDREKIINIIDKAFIKSISNGDYDVEYRTVGVEDQKIRWVRAKGKVYFNKDEKPVRFIGSVLDITEKVNAVKKIEETVTERTKELAEANNSLQKSNAELAQFAYIASHDLQEPLRKIITFSQMLERNLEGFANDTSKNYLSKIKSSSDRMTTLINDVLKYSQIVKENEIFKEVDLDNILTNVIADYDLLIEQKEAVIQCDKLPVTEAIPLQMTQLFGNLLGNALKFSRKDIKPVIKINRRDVSKEDYNTCNLSSSINYFSIEFTDNGIGLQPEYTEKIFNIFQRLHSKVEYEGTGIGLAMCKKIALNHYGDIYAKANSESGATFIIILPLKQQ